MNLRTLKKLSKRAMPLLIDLGETREFFAAKKGENYHGAMIRARKHWVRMRCHPSCAESRSPEQIVYTSRQGHRILMWQPCHPLKGTQMVGGTVGYYEPEWEEQAAYLALSEWVYAHFTDWCSEPPMATRNIKSPRDVFAAARDMVREAKL